tara:strand:- start:567 stop:749 length:183 start_codon:yes stop_codon:yes gene_type:complete
MGPGFLTLRGGEQPILVLIELCNQGRFFEDEGSWLVLALSSAWFFSFLGRELELIKEEEC